MKTVPKRAMVIPGGFPIFAGDQMACGIGCNSGRGDPDESVDPAGVNAFWKSLDK